MEDKIYTTISGDTFDTIAYKIYGDSKSFVGIIESNQQYSGVLRFEAGVKLIIPKKEKIKDENIAPWRR